MFPRSKSIPDQLAKRQSELPLRYSVDRLTKLVQSRRSFAQALRNFQRERVADVIEKLAHDVGIAAHRFAADQLCFFSHCEHHTGSLYAYAEGISDEISDSRRHIDVTKAPRG